MNVYEGSYVGGRSKTKRQRVARYARNYWMDWLCVAILGAFALGVYSAAPLTKRLFAVYSTDSNGVKEPIQFDDAYPIRKEIIPTTLAGVIAGASGLIVILVAQIWVRSTKDCHRAILCLVTCLVAASWFQVVIKWMIGGFRPNFLEICKPDMTKVAAGGEGYYGIYFDRSICTGDKDMINDALESFPSGHSTAAFAGNVFIFLYLNAKLKLWSSEYAAAWKVFLVFLPLLAACILSLCRLVDYTHHWYDLLGGAIIGAVFACSVYRMHYQSLFNGANNHLLLRRRKKGPDYEEINHGRVGPSNA